MTLDEAKRYLAVAEHSAELWQGTAWQAAILGARANPAPAEGDHARAAGLLAEAAAGCFLPYGWCVGGGQ